VDVKPRLGLRHWLTLLVIGTTLPLLLFAGATLYKMARDARAAQEQGQADTVRALALAVDGEVRAWTAVVTALAESQSLRQDRLAEFYAEARQVAAPHDGWVVLTVVSGEQLLNTLRPYGAPLAKTSSPETIAAIFRDGKPIVSDVFYGQNAQRYMVAVAVPVVRGGTVVNCLTLNFAPQRLTQVLQGQQVPPTWTAAINDRQGRVVARSQHIEQRIGKPTVPWLIKAIQTAEHGLVTGSLTDGRLGQVAFQRLREVPWTVTLTIPVAELPSARPVQWFALLAVLLGTAALGAAFYASRRITAPIGRLASHATALLQGDAPALGGPLPVREVEALRQALIEASATAQALHHEQARVAVAEEQAKAAAAAAQASRDHADALQASEARFRELFEHATDAILVTDPTGPGRVLAVNPAACRLFGYPEGEFIGLTREAILETTDGQVAPMLHARERNGRAGAEITYKRKDGTRFPGELTSAVFDPSGAPRRAVAIIRDITARKQAEEALRQLNATLEQRVQDRTAELAQKASQLQALTAELTLAEQRERQRLAEVLHDGLQQLLVAAKLRLTFLPRADPSGVADGCREVTDLLGEAIASSRKLTGELSPPILQTGGLVAGLEWLVRWKAERYQLAVELQADPRAVPDSEAMTLLLFQSVRELLFNVVKHAQVNAARVEVRQQHGHLQIIVSDQGVGFDPTTLPTTGTGRLGLSSIRQRIEYLGGCVGIASAPGQGCRVTLAAPLESRASASAAPAVLPEAGQPSRHSGRGAKIRILLVDDHAVVRHALAQMLGAEPDLEVVGEAADGKIGVELTKDLQPDVVLMDISMPVLNGTDATRQIYADCPGVRVIGLSMFGAAEQTAALRSAGAVAYVSKTAPTEELLAAIRAAVRRSS
jgi:PAS domain S-box-containing protein